MDGHSGVRLLANALAQIVGRYTFDGYCNTIATTRNITNHLMYEAKWFDFVWSQYYLRARAYLPSSGRFSSMDSVAGDTYAPASLHKYLYVADNAINAWDPTGHEEEAEVLEAASIGEWIDSLFIRGVQVASQSARSFVGLLSSG